MKWGSRFLIAVVTASLVSSAVWAETLKSPNYSLNETLLGGGGLSQSSSPNYTQRDGISDTVVGESSSTNFNSRSGYTTDGEPMLSFVVNTTTAAFSGAFSTASVRNATATFSVKNYTSYGYNVSINGTAPKNGSYTLAALASNTASSPGSEQFGINLKANTGFGADPSQVPGSSWSFGTASTNYDTANSFRYVSGEQIANAPKSSGETDFTISFIVNVKGTTPGGSYSSGQQLICVGTY
ncbi:MAG TPA: hypothetical protein VLF41_03280 [Candidatus Nanoarchaeia archaeon]|nr:hypothetical protein [Candidatus Nanoarchaeia archaeon]